jgi:transglutaminase-like putative cysteine protease
LKDDEYNNTNKDEYLKSTYFIDCNNPIILEIVKKLKNNSNNIENAQRIFYFTRDQILYNPYESFTSRRVKYKASNIAKAGKGWCVQKASVLAALARAIKIPSRLHFADIRNHQITDKLLEVMQTDIFVFHGYTELFLNGKWVKATPAFNIELCEKFNYRPVEFDGIHDAILPTKTIDGEKHIEYIRDRGIYSDFPFKKMFKVLHEYYSFA